MQISDNKTERLMVAMVSNNKYLIKVALCQKFCYQSGTKRLTSDIWNVLWPTYGKIVWVKLGKKKIAGG